MLGLLITVVSFLFVLAIVVIVHELGHYLVARWCGVKVEAFSIGFGPELTGFTDRHGTRWRIAAFPLGGYVRFLGDADAASSPNQAGVAAMPHADRARSLPAQTVGRRAAIVAAGPIANFLFAIAIFTISILLFGRPVLTPLVERVEVGSVAEAAGFMAGDTVVSIDAKPIVGFVDLQRIVSVSAGQELTIVVRRDGAERTLKATPRIRESKSIFGTQRIGQLGIIAPRGPGAVRTDRHGPISALSFALDETWYVVERSGALLAGLFSGKESPDQLSGPLRIATLAGEVAKQAGVGGLVTLAAFLSISIGLINLLPIPLLDGGHLLFYAIEALRGRPVGENAQEYAFWGGLGAILMLVSTVLFLDITALTGN